MENKNTKQISEETKEKILADIRSQLSIHPNIFMPTHLRDKPLFPMKIYIDAYEMEALGVIFGFTDSELCLPNEVANYDMLWRDWDDKSQVSGVDMAFAVGARIGEDAEHISIIISYLFDKYRDDGEEWFDDEDCVEKKMAMEYRKRMADTYATPREWLYRLFMVKYENPDEPTISHLVEMYKLEKRWKRN